MNQNTYTILVDWLLTGKGSAMPGFSSEKVRSGQVSGLLDMNIKVSPNCGTDYVAVVVPKVCGTWKSLTSLTSKAIEEPGIGTTLRVWEEGEALLTDPKAVVLITDILS